MPEIDFPPQRFRPWAGNPLRGRADVEAALRALVAPAERFRSAGGARVRIGLAGANFDQAAADLEGYSRLLWGLVPAQMGGADWIDWAPIRRGLAAGVDPAHPEYWGDPAASHRQRLVEFAGVGLALRCVPEAIWDPLSAEEKSRIAGYLSVAHGRDYADNNWKFFRLMLSMGLRSVGVALDARLDATYRDGLDGFYLGDGWYSDGDARRADHYIPFAFHFYGLILAALGEDDALGARYRERARTVTPSVLRWFADDGAALVFGRSMTYRCAIAGFFGALALANEEAAPWGVLKGFYLRHLRWWARQPFAAADGTLPIGYAYPNLLISEAYNSPQSPYWALKAFLPLAVPESHPFWAAEELPCPPRPAPAANRHAGMLVANPPGDAVALVSGQQNLWVRLGAEKYAKFAYSARYGFSVESDPSRFDDAVLDGMIGFSDDGRHFRVREANEIVLIGETLLYARWRPYPEVVVETWLYWDGPFHVRVHRVDTPRPLRTIEGGFAVRIGAGPETAQASTGFAAIETAADLSAIVNIGSDVPREGRAHKAPPNTNLIAPATTVPQLIGALPAGVSILGAAVIAQGEPRAVRAALAAPPARPDVAALAARVAAECGPVTLMRGDPDA